MSAVHVRALSVSDREREALLARIAEIRGDNDIFLDASVEELRRVVGEFETACRIINKKGGRLKALWALSSGEFDER